MAIKDLPNAPKHGAGRLSPHAGTEFRRIASETVGVLNKSAKEHERIVEAVRQRDPQLARLAMRDHLASIANTTAEAMKSLQLDK